MEQVGITKIAVTNPMLAAYVKTIEKWDEKGEFCSKNKAESESKDFSGRLAERLNISQDNGYFYGIFLDDRFLGASRIIANEKTGVDILVINGSLQHYEEIEKVATQQLTSIASVQYNTDNINVKRIGVRQHKMREN